MEKINDVLNRLHTNLENFEPEKNERISRQDWFLLQAKKGHKIEDEDNFNFSVSADKILEQHLPYHVIGCTGRARLFVHYAKEMYPDLNLSVVLTVKKNYERNKKFIDGHQVIAVETEEGLKIIDPGKRKPEFVPCDKVEKGERIIFDGGSYIIADIESVEEYETIKSYEDIEKIYKEALEKQKKEDFQKATNNIKSKTVKQQNIALLQKYSRAGIVS